MYLALLFLISLACYVVPHILHIVLRKENDLKGKYGQTHSGEVWALVTGASSGIGKAVVLKLASKGINIVLVAKNDELLPGLQSELQAKYDNLKFRAIGVDLSISGGESMREIAENTNDLQITMVFNIAGYMHMDNFANAKVLDKLANIECNVTSLVRITDHFYKRMVSNRTPGAIAFTASSTAFIPSPYSPVYAAGKAFVSSFAHSLAIEAKEHKIDIFVVHPGAVNTSFFDKFPNFSIFKALRFIGQSPEDVAEIIISNLGRTISLDSGLMAFIGKFCDKVLGPNVTIPLMRFLVPFFSDWHKEYQTKRYENKKDS